MKQFVQQYLQEYKKSIAVMVLFTLITVSVFWSLAHWKIFEAFTPITIIATSLILSAGYWCCFMVLLKPLYDANKLMAKSSEFGIKDLQYETLLSALLPNFSTFMKHLTQESQACAIGYEQLTVDRQVLRYQLDRVYAVLNADDSGLMIIDETGKVVFVNQTAASIFSATSEEVSKTPVSEWCSSKDFAAYLEQLSNRHQGDLTTIETQFGLAGEVGMILRAKAKPLFYPTGAQELFGFIVSIVDVTKAQASTAAHSGLFEHVSFELQQPLNNLIEQTEVLLDERADCAEQRHDICQEMHDEIERMIRLNNNIISFNKVKMTQGHLTQEVVSLNELLNSEFDKIRRAAEERAIKLEIKLDVATKPVKADSDLFAVAINNLLFNAIKYNRQGGSIKLKTKQSLNSLTIHILDTGIGMDKVEQTKVFEMFYSSEQLNSNEHIGHGLGLTLAKNIIEAHGGDLKFTSKKGVGTEFTIKIDTPDIAIGELYERAA